MYAASIGGLRGSLLLIVTLLHNDTYSLPAHNAIRLSLTHTNLSTTGALCDKVAASRVSLRGSARRICNGYK